MQLIIIKRKLWLIMCLIYTTALSAQNISRIEYFIDTDPGFGNATLVTITPGQNIPDLLFTADISSTGDGFHTLFVRSWDGTHWSVTATISFVKGIATNASMQKLEYFFGADPGFGNAATVLLPAIQNVNNFALPVDISSSANGFNTLSIRTFDGVKWSITNQLIFVKGIINNGLVSEIEYFINTDPGFGNGTQVSFTAAANISDLMFTVNTNALANGNHLLFVRSRETTGNWSITGVAEFFKGPPLPVTLLSFLAKAAGKQVLLNWQTATEINNKRFIMEWSTDGINFSAIGEVPGTGNSNTTQSYQFTHLHPSLNGNNWYRLKQVDLDGQYTYSPVRLVRFVDGQNLSISVFPTISNNQVKLYNTTPGQTVALFDAQGHRVKQQNITSAQIDLTISDLAKAAYILVVHEGGRIVLSQKIIKN